MRYFYILVDNLLMHFVRIHNLSSWILQLYFVLTSRCDLRLKASITEYKSNHSLSDIARNCVVHQVTSYSVFITPRPISRSDL